MIQVEAGLRLLPPPEPAAAAAMTRPASTSAAEHDATTGVPEHPQSEVVEPASEPEPAAPTAVASAPAIAIAPPAITPAMWPAREAAIAQWELATPLPAGFGTIVDASEARRRTALVLLAATLPTGAVSVAVRLALGTKRGQTYMDVHESDGTLWLNKERFEELARFLAEREAASGRRTHGAASAEADALAQLAEREGYRAERIASNLGPAPNVDAPTSGAATPLVRR